MSVKAKQQPQQKESPEPDLAEDIEYTIGKVHIPKIISQTINGYMTANDLKYQWDITPRFRLIQYREEEYVEDEDDWD